MEICLSCLIVLVQLKNVSFKKCQSMKTRTCSLFWATSKMNVMEYFYSLSSNEMLFSEIQRARNNLHFWTWANNAIDKVNTVFETQADDSHDQPWVVWTQHRSRDIFSVTRHWSWIREDKTLPKAQRTRGLSSGYQSNFFRSYVS